MHAERSISRIHALHEQSASVYSWQSEREAKARKHPGCGSKLHRCVLRKTVSIMHLPRPGGTSISRDPRARQPIALTSPRFCLVSSYTPPCVLCGGLLPSCPIKGSLPANKRQPRQRVRSPAIRRCRCRFTRNGTWKRFGSAIAGS